ncbi:Mbeg1-like protein [uncultured Senegalimassilia sp.]|uniref:Mbeg1-like protein n=1 Tax=uncultured Senegalimassilia sp. TaxID=1714350 RepID=UPI0025D7FADB|nr:Mbeg1-like protein [uncultured Senegalimassilia sp.]
MDSIVTYIEREQRTFTESPANPVDSLVFSSLCYFNFDKLVLKPGLSTINCTLDTHTSTPVLLSDILALCQVDLLTEGSWLKDSEDTLRFIQAIRASRRYRNVSVALFVDEISDAVDKQFSASTFFFDSECGTMAYIAFRGTDGTLTGWKEDFNLSYKTVIPSQRSALAYVSGVSSATTCPLILGGHSKGGNLAQYAALCTDEGTYQRIVAVYDHDGPSFLEDPSPRRATEDYDNKLHKLVPESSAFGMILERRDDYRVVQSSASALFQHHPFSWMVDGDDFVYQQDLNASAQFFDEALDTWLRSKTPAERERFIQTIYDLIMQTNATSWADFQTRLGANVATVMGAGSKLDVDTKQFLISTLGSLGATLKDQTIARIKDAGNNLLQNDSRKRNNQ